MLAVGDERLRAVEHIAVAGLLRGGAHALEIGTGAGLAHRDGADQFAGGELRQPAALLVFGAVMQNVGRDDTGVQRRAKGVEARKAQLPVDHGLVREGAAGAAILFGDRRTEQPRRAGLGPDFAVIHPLLVPAIDLRHELGVDEAPRLVFEQHEVLGHPGRAGNIERIHGLILYKPTIQAAAPAREGADRPRFPTIRGAEGRLHGNCSWSS